MLQATSFTTVPLTLTRNPTISDKALAGVIEANITGFDGTISVVSKVYTFAAGKFSSRVIYITPYGKTVDFLVSVKRLIGGVEFDALTNNGSHITEYVLGVLKEGTPEYQKAEQETLEALEQKRRFTIAISTDCQNLSITIDQNQGACTIL